jgi:hypothetical protein
MRGWLAELALFLLAWTLFAAACSAALSLAWPALAAGLRRLAPARLEHLARARQRALL